jgi:ribonuclease BN (tRNA processing enzyme)
MAETQIIFLGTGTPNIFSNRMGPSIAIKYEEEILLFDAGIGLVRRAKEAKLDISKLTTLFLSHLHSDHTVGLPDFMFTPSVSDRKTEIKILGPKGTQAMINSLRSAYQLDIQIRVEGLEKANPKTYTYNVVEFENGIVYTNQTFTIESFPVKHGNWDAVGFKITAPDKIIVYSGDTQPCETLIEVAKGCDVLIHEVYSLKNFHLKTPQWQNYHRNMHTSSKELALIAQKVSPKHLVLFHQLFWEQSPEGLVNEVKSNYKGMVINAKDLLIL